MADPTPPADAVQQLAGAILAAVREQSAPPPLLVDHAAGAAMLGLSRSGWFRLVGSAGFPAAVEVPGSRVRWRRADLERWAAKLKPRRRSPRAV